MLFRHYLKLHPTVPSFNVDPQFAEVVDGLLADLRRSDSNFVRRFLGAGGYAKFAPYHGIVDQRIGGRMTEVAAKR